MMGGITKDQIQKMVQELANKGPNIEISTAKTILDNKKESLPLLTDLLGKTEVWEPPYKDYSAWTPIAIIHLLSLMGGKDAFEAVRKATLVYYDDAGDWITTDFPSVAATFGPEIFDEMVDILKDGSIDIWIRVGVANALFMISNDNNHPEIKEEAVKVLKETISKEKQNKNARTLLADELVNFKDQGSLSFIKGLFEDRMLDESIVTFKDVCDVYEGKYDDIIKDKIKNPLHIFKEGSFYRQSNSGDFKKQFKPDGEEEKEDMQINDTPSVKKIGRNDPCPCGSGKKYKKCCMLL